MRSADTALPPEQWPTPIDDLKQGLLIVAALLAVLIPPAGVATVVSEVTPDAVYSAVLAETPSHFADFVDEPAVPDAEVMAAEVASASGELALVVVDKRNACLYVFDRHGRMMDAVPIGETVPQPTFDSMKRAAPVLTKVRLRSNPFGPGAVSGT